VATNGAFPCGHHYGCFCCKFGAMVTARDVDGAHRETRHSSPLSRFWTIPGATDDPSVAFRRSQLQFSADSSCTPTRVSRLTHVVNFDGFLALMVSYLTQGSLAILAYH